jgi:hypothetical protein
MRVPKKDTIKQSENGIKKTYKKLEQIISIDAHSTGKCSPYNPYLTPTQPPLTCVCDPYI